MTSLYFMISYLARYGSICENVCGAVLVMSRFDVCQELSPEATVSKTTYKSASAGDKSTMKTPGRDDHGGDSCESFDTNEYSGCIYYSRRVQN